MATKITEHFDYESFWANSSTAKKYHIDNTPDEAGRNNIYKIVRTILEPIAIKYGKPIRVNSSYRCDELNRKVGGSKTSQHKTGQAVDIAAKGGGGTNAMLFYCVYNMIKSGEIKVGQLIWEFGNERNPNWVHVSLPYRKVNNIIRATTKHGKTKYIPFDLKEGAVKYKGVFNGSLEGYIPSTDDPEGAVSDGSNNTTFEESGPREGGLNITTIRTPMSDKRRVTNDYKKQ